MSTNRSKLAAMRKDRDRLPSRAVTLMRANLVMPATDRESTTETAQESYKQDWPQIHGTPEDRFGGLMIGILC